MLTKRRQSTESSLTNRSIRTDTTWRYSVFGPDRLGRGAMVFTGPDGNRDYRACVEAEHRYVGEGTMSPEGTSEVDYLWRAPAGSLIPRPKSYSVGSIGWGVPEMVDWSAILNGSHIRLGEFRQTALDLHPHFCQNAWYAGPKEKPNPVVIGVYQPASKAALIYDRYGRRIDAMSTTRHGYGRNPAADKGFPMRTGSRTTSHPSSATVTSERSVYGHYADGFSRPKSAYPDF